MRKIIDAELINLAEAGTPQKDIAAHFRVSEAAISKRLKRLRQIAARPAILDKLTAKEERFVLLVVQGSNQTQAALNAFDVGSLDSAKSIGSRLMKDDDIKEAINTLMETEGLTRRYLIRKLKNHIDAPDPQVSIRGIDIGLKLHGAYPASVTKNMNINADITDADVSRWFNG